MRTSERASCSLELTQDRARNRAISCLFTNDECIDFLIGARTSRRPSSTPLRLYDGRGFFFSQFRVIPVHPSVRFLLLLQTPLASVKEKGCILLFFARQPNCRAISRLIGYRSIFGASLSGIHRSRVWQGIYQPCPGADKCINSFFSCFFHGIRETRHFNDYNFPADLFNPPATCFLFVFRLPRDKEKRGAIIISIVLNESMGFASAACLIYKIDTYNAQGKHLRIIAYPIIRALIIYSARNDRLCFR